MSLLFKKTLEKIKDFDTEQKVTELDVAELLENDWEEHFTNQIFKKGNLVYINLAVKKGNTAKILKLPEEYRPKSLIYISATDLGGTTGLGAMIHISAEGEVFCENKNVGSLVITNATYKI